jgi:23S rRNA (guanosine2251-2'-O)-methyltransferase
MSGQGRGRSAAGRSGTGRSGAGKAKSGKSAASKAGTSRGKASLAASGLTKTGKPRPGTGGKGRRALEGRGPTPPAEMRPGHPAQRRAAQKTGSGKSDDTRAAGYGGTGAGYGGSRSSGGSRTSGGPRGAGARDAAVGPHGTGSARSWTGAARPSDTAVRGSGDAPEFVAGRNPVVESLRASVPAMALYVGPRAQQDERVSEAVKLAAQAGIAVLEAGPTELDRLTGGALHQGVALRVRPYNYAHPDDLIARAEATGQLPLIVALDSITDPRNLGAVVRTAAAFGAHGVVVPSRRGAGVTAGAWKASAGALARVPVARASNLTRTLHNYREAGIFIAGLDGAGDTEIRDLELASAPLVLVVGSEGKGLSRVVAQACDMIVQIPIAARTESLNAGIAASIALYEVASVRSRLP